MFYEEAKKLGKNQKLILIFAYSNELPIIKHSIFTQCFQSLLRRGFVEIQFDSVHLTNLGNQIVENALLTMPNLTLDTLEELLIALEIQTMDKLPENETNVFVYHKLRKNEIMFLQFLCESPCLSKHIRRAKKIIPNLEQRNLIQISDDEIQITNLGIPTLKETLKLSKYNFNPDEISEIFLSEMRVESKQKSFKQSDEFLELYKQGLTYQAIGDMYELSRERVRQILVKNRNWERTLQEFEDAKIQAENESDELKRQKFLENSLAYKYPERVSELWDYEKNGDLKPESFAAKGLQKIWLKCPKDGHSWQKKSNDVSSSWDRFGSSGCPKCANRTKKPERQPLLSEAYFEFVVEYWDFGKNDLLNLNPEKLPCGSNHKVWFKCPKDGNEWQASISSTIIQQWSKGNTGCRVCNGTHLRKRGVWGKAEKLIAVFPNEVAKYWNYKINDKFKIYPSDVTIGSKTKAWFKCPVDNQEWQASISSIVNGSWKQGRSGCSLCGIGWTTEAIRQFIVSLEEHIPNLTQSERYKIFEQSGILGTNNGESLKIVKDIIKGKLTGQKLRETLQSKQIEKNEISSETTESLNPDFELKVIDTNSSVVVAENFHNEIDFNENVSETNDLPKIKVQKSLEFLNSNIVASSDQEAIDFFIASRRNRIWAEVFEDESAVEGMELFSDEGYGRQVRDQFLDEYNQARDMQIPQGWSFRIDGKITPPNLMQKVAAIRLKNQKRMLNLSLTGTGKTIGGILSSRIIDANLTIIICPLDTINNWHSEIKNVSPDSKVTTKNFNPYWFDVKDGHHFVILNHEMFQQPSTAGNIKQLLDRYKIDLIIVDEIHRCKQRSEDPSKSRQMVLALITNANEINSDLHVLGMSATPIINNLKEGKSLVELVTGIERTDLAERATINNCMKLHQAFVTLGIRSKVKPKINIIRQSIPIDCTQLVDEIRENGTSVLKMEQILTSARIPTILEQIRPKTIVYTHYVEGITELLKDAIEAQGWSVGFHIGGDKSGREGFIAGSIDVLIASSAMAVGVDGFQRVCDRLITNIPPWTSAELEQLEGRLNRQGQIHDSLTIIFPITFGIDGKDRWSWDEGRLARLQNKQTIADAAVDGVMPEEQLRTESQAFRDLRNWLDRLKNGEQKTISRPKIFVPLPETDEIEVIRRYANYGDFSRMNARWNNSYSSTTFQRLQSNPEEWMQYHTFCQQARKTWSVIPFEETVKWLEKRSNLSVGDFGCGEAILAKRLSNKHTIYSFDFIAINDLVIECDTSKVPLEDSVLDVVVFNLSLMGLNFIDCLKEASRTLKLDGQLWIYETESQMTDVAKFVEELAILGFKIIENSINWKFRFIWAIKSN